MSKKGYIIAIEGTDGCGKTTTISEMKKLLAKDERFVFAKEPGGTKVSEAIKEVIMNNDMDKMTELILFEASRHHLFHTFIKPNLEKGKIIIMDRFTPYTYIYQSEIEEGMIKYLNSLATEGHDIPDLIIYLDMPLDEQYKRISHRQNNDRMDNLDKNQLKILKNKYKAVLERYSNVCYINIDASKKPEDIAKQIIHMIFKNIL